MPTLQEQLKDLEKEVLELDLANPLFYKLRKVIKNVNFYGCVGSVILFFLILFFLSEVVWNKIENIFLGLVFIYGGIYLAYFLANRVYLAIEKLAFQYFNITKDDLLNYINLKEALLSKIKEIERNLAIEKRNEARNQEQLFISRISEFINNLVYRKISIEDGLNIKKELERENYELSKLGYQIYTEYYYNGRFKYIEDILKNLDLNQPIHSEIPSQNRVNHFINSTASNISPILSSASASNFDTSKVDFTEYPKSIADLGNGRSSSETSFKSNVSKPNKVDYLELQEKRQEIGYLGEKYALEWERRKMKGDLKMYVDKIVHVAQSNDSLGYDIVSFFQDGSPKYIEVKTTTDNYNSPFYLTETENSAMKRLENYFIYRIYNFDIGLGLGELEEINCKMEMEKNYKFQIVSYKVTPK